MPTKIQVIGNYILFTDTITGAEGSCDWWGELIDD